jgi:hypothetical protein
MGAMEGQPLCFGELWGGGIELSGKARRKTTNIDHFRGVWECQHLPIDRFFLNVSTSNHYFTNLAVDHCQFCS